MKDKNRTALLIGNDQLKRIRVYAASNDYTMQASVDYIIDKFFHDLEIGESSSGDIAEELMAEYDNSITIEDPVVEEIVEGVAEEEVEEVVEEEEEELVEGTYDDINDLL